MSDGSERFSLRKISLTALGSIVICTAVTWARWPDKSHWSSDKTAAVMQCAKGNAFPGWLDPVHLAEQLFEEGAAGQCEYAAISQTAVTSQALTGIEREARASCAPYGGLAKIDWPYPTRPALLENHDNLAYAYLHRPHAGAEKAASPQDIAVSIMLSNGEELPDVKRYRALEAATYQMNALAGLPSAFSRSVSISLRHGLPAQFICSTGVVHNSSSSYVP